MEPGGLPSSRSRQNGELQVERLPQKKRIEKGKEEKNGEMNKEDISKSAFVFPWAVRPARAHAL